MRKEQESFNPVDFGMNWIDDGTEYGWYEFDSIAAHKAAKEARDVRAAYLRATCHEVRRSVMKKQRITRGGIGSGHPEVDFVVDVYRLTWNKFSCEE